MAERGTLGLFGGTFDPIHVGHLIVASDVIEGLGLDRLLVVPAGNPPHREPALPADVRLSLVRRAFADDPRVEVSDVEVRRAGPSYTVDTLVWIQESYRPRELFLVIGVDQLRTLASWHEPERIPGLARVVVMTRGGEEPADVQGWAGTVPVETLPVTRVDLSATRIRERLGRGLTVRYLVPEPIREELVRAWEERGRPAAAGNDGARRAY